MTEQIEKMTGPVQEEIRENAPISVDESKTDVEKVIPVLAMHLLPLSMLSPPGGVGLLISQVKECVQSAGRPAEDMPSPAAVTPIRPPLGHILLPPEAHASSSAVSGLYMNPDKINKLHMFPFLPQIKKADFLPAFVFHLKC